MLVQVCHSEFYDRLDNEFQEVRFYFILRCLIYYLGFRNSYSACQNHFILRQIAKLVSLANFTTRRQVRNYVSSFKFQSPIISIETILHEES